MARKKTAPRRRCQKPIRGFPRTPVGAGVSQRIEARLVATAERFGVSRSFVIAVTLQDFFGIKNEERYDE